MKSKLWLLISDSLKRKIKSKWFLIVNIILIILIVSLINIDTIIKTFGGNFDQTSKILIIDQTDDLYDYIEFDFNIIKENSMGSINHEIEKYDNTINQAEKDVEEENHILIVIEEDEHNIAKATITSNKSIDNMIVQALYGALNNAKMKFALENTTIDQAELAKIYSEIEINQVTLSDERDVDTAMTMVMSTVFPVVILPFFMLAVIAVQFIGTEINEEKSSKGMEIILSNVSAKTHLLSKIIANNLFVFIQGGMLFLSAALGMIIRYIITGNNILTEIQTMLGSTFDVIKSTGFIDKLTIIIPLVLILMIFTFIGFSLLSGVLASMTTSMEDYQQMQMPTVFLLLFSYYIAIMAGMFDGSIFIKVLGYVPFVSAILSPALLILGQFTILDMLISIVITIISIIVLYHYGLKIYKVGILNYSSENLFKKIFNAVKGN